MDGKDVSKTRAKGRDSTDRWILVQRIEPGRVNMNAEED